MYNFNNQWIREESDWFAYFNESDRRNCIALFCRFSHASVELAIFRRQIALPQFKVIQLVRFTKRKPQSLLRTLRAIYTRDCRMPLLKSKSCWLIARLEGLFSCAQAFTKASASEAPHTLQRLQLGLKQIKYGNSNTVSAGGFYYN